MNVSYQLIKKVKNGFKITPQNQPHTCLTFVQADIIFGYLLNTFESQKISQLQAKLDKAVELLETYAYIRSFGNLENDICSICHGTRKKHCKGCFLTKGKRSTVKEQKDA